MQMKLNRRAAALALALVLALSLSVPALAAPASAERQASAAETVRYAAEYGQTANLSYALWEDGALTLGAAVPGPASRVPEGDKAVLDYMGRDLYGVGSASKIYTTVAVMQLVEQGRVELDAPLTRYLKTFKMADERYRDITVRMLLNHSSGLMGTTSTNALLFADPDEQAADTLLEKLSTQRLRADPGAFSAYCNDGFTLAQLLVEAVSGREFMDVVRASILIPAGLKETFAPRDEALPVGRLSPTYVAGVDRELPQETLGIVGAGGMYATASDLAAFGGALTGTKLLSAKSAAAMASAEYDRGIWPDEPLGAVSFGLGWDAVEFWPFAQNGIQCLVKGGDTLRYHAALLVLPEYKMAAAVLSSGGMSVYNELAAAQLLVEALEAKGVKVDQSVPALPEAKPAAMPPSLTQESGYYGTTTQQLGLTVTADGKLTIDYLGAGGLPDQVMTYYSDGSFRDAGNSVRVKLVKESNGSTYFYQNSYGQIPGLGVLPTGDYLLVKMPENKVDPAVLSAWDELMTLSTLPLAEKYTSQAYLSLAMPTDAQAAIAALIAPESVPGYVRALRIASPTELRYDLPIGRDITEMTLAEENGARYLYASGAPYQLTDSLRTLSTGSGSSRCTIQPDGYARWYTVGPNAAGKTMTVSVPENAGFYVYGDQGALAASSFLWGDASVKLTENSLVVFAGAPGARFQLKFA